MKPEKHVVALHEAGHLLVVLSTPLKQFLESARISDDTGEWAGEVCLDRVRLNEEFKSKRLPGGRVFTIANGLAGPLAQIEYYPESIPEELSSLINKNDKSLLFAARRDQKDNLGNCVHWWLDLEEWLADCKRTRVNQDEEYRSIEREIVRVLSDEKARRCISFLKDALLAKHELTGDEIRSFPLDFPTFNFPDKIGMQFPTTWRCG